MAQHGTVTRNASQTAPPPVRTSSGRVPPGRETARRRVKEPEFDYTRWRQTVSTMADFRRYVEGYPEKRGLLLYLYRLKPRIDTNLIGKRETVQLKIAQPDDMTEAYITSKMGRGRYMLALNDANRPKGEKEVLKTWLTVDDPTAPDPVYDVRTLCLGDSDNIDEVNRLIENGTLIRDGATSMPRLRTDRDITRPAEVQTGGNDLVSRDVMGQVMVALIKQGAQQPGEVISQALNLAKTMMPQTGGVTLDQIEAILDRRLALIQSSSNAVDPLASWERVNGFVEKVRGAAGGVIQSVTSDATLAGLSELARSAAVLIPEVVRGLEFLQRQRAQTNALINQRAGNNGSVPNNPQQPGAPGAPQMTMADKITEVCTMAFQQMELGITGFDFAAYTCTWHPGGRAVFDFLVPYGSTGTIGLLTTNPDAAKLLADPAQRERVETFLNDFFDYDPDGKSSEEPAGPSV